MLGDPLLGVYLDLDVPRRVSGAAKSISGVNFRLALSYAASSYSFDITSASKGQASTQIRRDQPQGGECVFLLER